jgi:cell wall-associated NlpC family hydrolase
VSISSNRTTVRAGARWSLPLSRHTLGGALLVVAIVGVAVVLMSGGGHPAAIRATRASAATGSAPPATTGATTGGAGHTGALAARRATQATGQPNAIAAHPKTGAAVGPKAVAVAEVRDPEEAKSFPLPASVHHRSATSPSVAGEAAVAPGAASDAQVRKELGEEQRAEAQARAAQQRVLTPMAGGFSVGGNGTISIPSGAPEVVQRVIAGGNAIADFPYIWGGGHASFIANGYDCSGSVSYALAAGGLLSAPLVSGDLASWGEAGLGRWITIYANAGHTFMDVDGMWFDTAGRSGPYASRWLVATPPLEGYAVRHPPGL